MITRSVGMRWGFTIEEDELLIEGLQKYGGDWHMVEQHVETKSAGECLKRFEMEIRKR